MNATSRRRGRTGARGSRPTFATNAARVRARAPLEPLVELRRARRDDAVARDPVHLDRLARPEGRSRRGRGRGRPGSAPCPVRLSQLATQTAARDPGAAGALQVLDLAAGELDHRRDEHRVRPALRGGSSSMRPHVGIARSTAPSEPMTPPVESRSLECDSRKWTTRSVSRARHRIDGARRADVVASASSPCARGAPARRRSAGRRSARGRSGFARAPASGRQPSRRRRSGASSKVMPGFAAARSSASRASPGSFSIRVNARCDRVAALGEHLDHRPVEAEVAGVEHEEDESAAAGCRPSCARVPSTGSLDPGHTLGSARAALGKGSPGPGAASGLAPRVPGRARSSGAARLRRRRDPDRGHHPRRADEPSAAAGEGALDGAVDRAEHPRRRRPLRRGRQRGGLLAHRGLAQSAEGLRSLRSSPAMRATPLFATTSF